MALLVGVAVLAASPCAFSATDASTLPLRTASVVGIDDVLRISLTLMLLLAATCVGLWWYQRRNGRLPPGFRVRTPALDVVARLQLTRRTQVFVIRRGEQEFLLTESATGTTVIAVPSVNATPSANTDAKRTGDTP